jgi:endosialidase-like protein
LEELAQENTALLRNTTGNHNTACGNGALFANTIGNNNIALGQGAGNQNTTGSNNIDIGNIGFSGDSHTIRVGSEQQTRTFIAGISGAAVMGAAVHISAAGQLGTAPSSARFKQEIKPMDKASEAVLALRPVTFRDKPEVDPDGTPQFGSVAEEVEKVNPALITRDADGKPYTVRYDAVNAMLLNEFLKAHRQIEEQRKEIEALKTLIQKVSDKVELSKPAPQTVLNNQ